MHRTTVVTSLVPLFLVVLAGSGMAAQGATLPAPSPDGERLAFVSTVDGDSDIHILDLVSGDVTRLTRSSGNDTHPTWSPDGRRLAYTVNREDESRVRVVASDGSDLGPVTSEGTYAMNPAWSPDGRWIAVAAGEFPDLDLWLYDPSGESEPVQLTRGPGADYWPSWSPDGSRLAFVQLHLEDGPPPDLERSGIAVLDVDTGERRLLVSGEEGISEAPSFSPDGSRIAFHRRRGEDFDLFTVDVEGGAPIPLRSGASQDEVPVWADGTTLYFQTLVDESWEIWSIASDGSDPHPVVAR